MMDTRQPLHIRHIGFKKSIICKLLMLCVLGMALSTFCACTSAKRSIDSDAKKREKQVFTALAEQDANALKALLSLDARNSANDLDNSIDELVQLFASQHVRYELEFSNSSEEFDNGKYSLRIIRRYTVHIDNTAYDCYMIDCPRNDFNVQQIGLQVFSLIPPGSDFQYWQDLSLGAYVYHGASQRER